MDLLIWAGPVEFKNVSSVVWTNPTEILIYNRGVGGGNFPVGSTAFSNLAESFRDGDGRILPRMLASKGKRIEQYDKIAIAGYSAFHGLANKLLASDGDLILAACLFDACFSAKDNPPKAGYVKFGSLAAQNRRFMLSTSGASGGGAITTGTSCAWLNFVLATGEAGVSAEPYAAPAPLPATTNPSYRAGNLTWLNYGSQYSHEEHATKLAAPVLQTMLVPYLATATNGLIAGGAASGGNTKTDIDVADGAPARLSSQEKLISAAAVGLAAASVGWMLGAQR